MPLQRYQQIRWLARIWSLPGLAFFALVLADGLSRGNLPDAPERLGFAVFPVGAALGMALGWWRPRGGGALTLASLSGYCTWQLWIDGRLPGGPWCLVFGAPGALFLIAWWLEARRSCGGRELAGA
ncbi:MAG: hypothetical protein KDH92_11330 [Chloroflexi bacterium]|nr:hypothetical protein [Chloroflexota bacterium]